MTDSPNPEIETQILETWKSLYATRFHDSAFEEMADPGELCDGELPSWRDARLRVEADPTVKVPQVSAHEAVMKLTRGLKGSEVDTDDTRGKKGSD